MTADNPAEHPGLTIRVRRVNACTGEVMERRPPVTVPGTPQPVVGMTWPPCRCGCKGPVQTEARPA